MVDFAETAMRKMCRNPKCRSKLPTPTSNEREAFCCRGCYSSFYLRRCRVCEGPAAGCDQVGMKFQPVAIPCSCLEIGGSNWWARKCDPRKSRSQQKAPAARSGGAPPGLVGGG